MKVKKEKKLNIEPLLRSLRNVSQTDIGWIGYQLEANDQVHDSINYLIEILKNTNWEEDDRAKKELHRTLNSLEGALCHENRLADLGEAKADCKMRYTLDHRLHLLSEILNRVSEERENPELDDLLRHIEEIKEENLDLLEESERIIQELRQERSRGHALFEDFTGERENRIPDVYPRAGHQITRGIRRAHQLAKIEEQKELSHHRMAILLTQSLLGNAYEFTDEEGNKILENALDELGPNYNEMLQTILNKNYRNATIQEVKETAYQTIDLIERGFSQAGWDLPGHIDIQIEELEEALQMI